jgi:hypothetical protein
MTYMQPQDFIESTRGKTVENPDFVYFFIINGDAKDLTGYCGLRGIFNRGKGIKIPLVPKLFTTTCIAIYAWLRRLWRRRHRLFHHRRL